jgi:hypothetical protein
MNGPLYRKTEQGVEEVATRRAGLDPRSRALLILCNGRHSVPMLSDRIGPHTAMLLADLVSRGLVTAAGSVLPSDAAPTSVMPSFMPSVDFELPMAAPRRAPSAPKIPPAAPPVAAAAVDTLKRAWRVLPKLGAVLAAERADKAARGPEALRIEVDAADLPATRQRAVAMVEALWGPGGGDRVGPIRRAATVDELVAALRSLYEAAAVFQGRKRADELMRRVLSDA